MQQEWRNLYKVSDLFSCSHRLHKHHESGTSAWHVLKYKSCYPEGCVSFLWKCRKFDDGHKCHRGKKHVGKDCFSCSFFYDEKRSFQPELKIPAEEYRDFQKEFAEFEEWVSEITRSRIEVRGKIRSVNPLLVNRGDDDSVRISCRGILLCFKEGIFHYDRFLDPFYARLSFGVYDRAGIAVGDEIDMRGNLQVDRGRFVFGKVGSIEIVRRSGEPAPTANELRQAQFGGAVIDGQPAKCLRCLHGLLIDSDSADGRSSPRRLMYCTKGVADYCFCPYRI